MPGAGGDLAALIAYDQAKRTVREPEVPLFTKLVEIPKAVLLPSIVILSVIGVYAINNNLYDIFWMVAFGVLGYFMKRYDYPVAPAVIGLIRASLIEKNFRRAIIVDGTIPGMILHCFTSPISLFLILVIIFMFATQSKQYKAFADRRAEQKKAKAAAKKQRKCNRKCPGV